MNKETFAKRVLMKLRVYDKGTALDPEDQETVNDTYNALFAELSETDAAKWLDGDEIPDNVALPMVALVAKELLTVYPSPDAAIIMSEAVEAKNRLYRQSAVGGPTEDEPEYY